MTEHKPKGGARRGSGRKRFSDEEKRVEIHVYLPPALLAQIDADRGAVSRNEWIRRKLSGEGNEQP